MQKNIDNARRTWYTVFRGAGVMYVYSFAPDYVPDKTVMYEDDNGAEHIVNLSKVSFMDLPLLKVEDEICNMLQDMIDS